MSNQRRGNWHKASGAEFGASQEMKLLQFFKSAKEVLKQYGHEDASFYFEQCEEHLRKGKSLTSESAGCIFNHF